MATMDDIARELGISKSTVSKALSGAKDISKKMQQTVLSKAVEMGYRRINRKTDTPRLALFVINMDYQKPDDFGYDLVMGFRQAAEPAGFLVDVIPLDQQLQENNHYDAYMMQQHYCGALFLGMSLEEPWTQEFETCRTPTVLYDNHVRCNPNVTQVGLDSTECQWMAINYLRSLGHEKIGYLGGGDGAYIYRQRYEAFVQVMSALGLPADESVTGTSFYVHECVSKHLPRLLKNGCTAIVCSHDLLANSVLIHCSEQGLRIPGDISILGHDDIPLCSYTFPPLSTIRQNRPAIGKSAFYAMNSLLNDVSVSTLLLHPELVERSSTGPCPPKK